MNLIKNAIVYRASLPDAEALALHLGEMPFHPILETMGFSHGFVPNPATGDLVTPIEGGLTFRYRRDAKIMPTAAVKAAIDAKIEEREAELERSLEKDEQNQLKEEVYADLLTKALSDRTEINGLYHSESRTLIVPTTNKNLANMVIGALIHACGAVETSTIHVSDVKGGLTSRLSLYFEHDERDAFNGFSLGDSVVMKGEKGKSSFDLDNLDHARQGVVESLHSNMQAERLELVHADAVSFKLTKDFHLRGIQFLQEPTDEELESRGDWDGAQVWRNEAAVQLLQMVALVKALCDLFGYQEPVLGADPVADAGLLSTGDDPLYIDAVAFVRESRRASISAVQRKLMIGYNRAARLMETMEAAGIVTAMNSNGSREVIQ